jgi:phosphoserine phosphatase
MLGAFVSRRLRVISLAVAKEQVLAPLTGTPVATLSAWAEAFWKESGAARIRPAVQRRVDRHLAAGHHVVVLSSVPDVHLAELTRTLGIHEAFGTPLIARNDRYSGKLGEHLFGQAKCLRLADICRATVSNVVHAYSDDASDLPLLEAAAHAYAVAPTRRLRVAARRRGWRIIEV